MSSKKQEVKGVVVLSTTPTVESSMYSKMERMVLRNFFTKKKKKKKKELRLFPEIYTHVAPRE